MRALGHRPGLLVVLAQRPPCRSSACPPPCAFHKVFSSLRARPFSLTPRLLFPFPIFLQLSHLVVLCVSLSCGYNPCPPLFSKLVPMKRRGAFFFSRQLSSTRPPVSLRRILSAPIYFLLTVLAWVFLKTTEKRSCGLPFFRESIELFFSLLSQSLWLWTIL